MSKLIQINYCTPSTYESKKGFRLNYRFDSGALDVFKVLPDDAIIFPPMLCDGEEWNTARAAGIMATYVVGTNDGSYKFKDQWMNVSKEVQPAIKKDQDVIKVTNQPIVIKEEENTMTTNTNATMKDLAVELGITAEDVEATKAALADSEIEEMFEFLEENNASYASKVRIVEAIESGDAAAVARAFKSAMMDPAIKPEKFGKAKKFYASAESKVGGFFSWAKEKGGNVLMFAWDSIKYVVGVTLSITLATVKFGVDIIGILFNHTVEAGKEICGAAVKHYGPIVEDISGDFKAAVAK